VTPAQIIELAGAAGRGGRRGPRADYARFPEAVSTDELAEFFFFVQEHGGHIDVESHEGRGTRFTVHLPLRSSDDAVNQAAA
jgi:hypothetical protein